MDFEREERVRVDPRENEPIEIRNLSKSQLYMQLAEEYHLPSKNSKGVNREYLVRVFQAQVLRVEVRDFKLFMAELTPIQLKKSPFVNLSDVYERMNVLLREIGHPPFGFSHGLLPEEKWLLGIVRFVDRANILGAFVRSLPVPGELARTVSCRIKSAQRNANTYLNQGIAEAHNKYWAQKAAVWESYKKLRSTNKDIEDQEDILRRLREKRNAEIADVNARTANLALMVYNLRNEGDQNVVNQRFFDDDQARDRMQGLIQV